MKAPLHGLMTRWEVSKLSASSNVPLHGQVFLSTLYCKGCKAFQVSKLNYRRTMQALFANPRIKIH